MTSNKRIAVRTFGGPEVLQVEDSAFPTPRTDQILVKVLAFGINPVETYIRNGLYDPLPSLPYTPGTDAAGIIHLIGGDVRGANLHAGQRVWITGSVSGTYAEYCVCNPTDVHPLPHDLTFQQGAALGIPYRTAYRALALIGQAKRGESLLIHGATGGVGIAAIQFAQILGLKPTIASTTSTDPAVHELLMKHGADEVIRHGEFDQRMKFDLILENLANVNLARDLKALKKNGRVIIVGNRGEVTINPRDLMRCEGSIWGMVGSGSVEDKQIIDAAIQEGLEKGHIRPVVGHVYRLAETSGAHEEIMSHSRGTRGKIVVSTLNGD
jgi:NADPH2:quinone reductase